MNTLVKNLPQHFKTDFRMLATLTTVVGLTSLLAACAPEQAPPPTPPRTIKIDGSSTVYPITKAIAEKYNSINKGQIVAESAVSGTGGGFKLFCIGQTDINDASRPILAKEIEVCKKNNVRYIELPIAFDALTIVVNPKNTWAKDITTAELKKIWDSNGEVKTWKQVRDSYPNLPIMLFGPGKDSGTYDYFIEAILGKGGAHRSDYTSSEDDNVLLNEVATNANALGYFGFAYYQKNQDKVRALPVDSGKGAIAPSVESVNQVKYQPLSRPLFIYVNFASTQKKEVNSFVAFYLDNAHKLVDTVGYISLPDEGYKLAKETYTKGEIGTVFEGKSQANLPIAEVLKKRAQF